MGRPELYACRWEECRHKVDRHRFPVSGLMGGLRQYRPGHYRLTIQGEGIRSLSQEFHVPDLDGGSVVLCAQLAASP